MVCSVQALPESQRTVEIAGDGWVCGRRGAYRLWGPMWGCWGSLPGGDLQTGRLVQLRWVGEGSRVFALKSRA